MKRNLKQSKNIYVSRIVILIVISIILNNIYIDILFGIILIFYNCKESIIYTILLLLILLTNSIQNDFIKYGIVEYIDNNYYIVNKILYKTAVKSSNQLHVGDIIKTDTYLYSADLTKQKRNIKYINENYEILWNFRFKRNIHNRIQELDDEIISIINKLIFNIYDYDSSLINLGYGLCSYYLFKYLFKKNKKYKYILIFIYSITFSFDYKFLLLIIDDIFKTNNNKYWYKIIIILVLNKCFIYNPSIYIPLLFELYAKINININYNSYFIMIESILYGSIDLLHIFFYKYFIFVQIFLLILSILTIFIPYFSYILVFLSKIYSYINNINFKVKGSFSIISFVIFLLMKKYINKMKYLDVIFILILLLSPINNPFFHVSYIDVDQGDAILIHFPLNKMNILIDTGSKYSYYKLRKQLDKEGIYKIDYLIITHNDEDHNGNIESLKKDYIIDNIIEKGVDINTEYGYLKYLYIDEFDNDNDSSLVYWLNINDISFLFTGDISEKAERKLISNYNNLEVDILKTSHHGSSSANSNYFISRIHPFIATISTSGKYNHPSSKTIDTLNLNKVDYYITRDSGTIKIFITKFINLLKTDNNEFVIIRSNDIHN